MNRDHQSKEEELRRREADLRQREINVRMRELESEIELAKPSKPKAKGNGIPSFGKRLPKIVQFGLLVIGVILAIRIAAALAGVFILLVIGWVGYKVFLERDRN